MQLRQELRLWFFSSSKKSQTLWFKRYVNKHVIDYTVNKNSYKHPVGAFSDRIGLPPAVTGWAVSCGDGP